VSPRTEHERIEDILQAIEAVEEHQQRARTIGLDTDDRLVPDAVVRQLAIIGEAASHLPQDVLAGHSHIPWSGVKGMRLLLDHEYHRVDADIVWRTVREDLPPLRAALATELPPS
jgi:uncharacterized protein with HEPN domain